MKPGSGHGRRHKTPGVVIILTDASASDSVSSSIPALKEVADRVIVVGMGYAVDKQQLNQIASNPVILTIFRNFCAVTDLLSPNRCH